MHLENKTWALQYIEINTAQWHIEWEVITAWGGTGAVKGTFFKEWKMVSSGSVQLEGPSPSPKLPTRRGQACIEEIHKSPPTPPPKPLQPDSPDTRRSPGNVFMCPTPSRRLHCTRSVRSFYSCLFRRRHEAKMCFKCPGYSGRDVGPVAVWNKSRVSEQATGANRSIDGSWSDLGWTELIMIWVVQTWLALRC